MKINHAKAIKAYKAINSLSQQQIPVIAALALFKTKKALQTIWDFSVQEETKLLEMFRPETETDGKMMFDNVDDEKNFYAGMSEIMAVEHDVDLDPVAISGVNTITVEQIENLDGIITFE